MLTLREIEVPVDDESYTGKLKSLQFTTIDTPLPSISPLKDPYKTNRRYEFVTIPNLSPRESSICAKFVASTNMKEFLLGWCVKGKVHKDSLLCLDQTS